MKCLLCEKEKNSGIVILSKFICKECASLIYKTSNEPIRIAYDYGNNRPAVLPMYVQPTVGDNPLPYNPPYWTSTGVVTDEHLIKNVQPKNDPLSKFTFEPSKTSDVKYFGTIS